LKLSGVWPNQQSWANFLSNALTWLGALAIALSVIFFVAFNWDDFGRFAKFGLLQAILVAAIGAYLFLAKKEISKKVLLTSASLFTGALLAYFHQTYQTGADPWQLFFTWGLLIIPWVIAAQFAPLWFFFVVLLNVTIYTYLFIGRGFFGFLIFDSQLSLLWVGFILNVVILLLWELAATKWNYLKPRWPVRIIAVSAGFAVSFLCLLYIIGYDDSKLSSLIAWVLSIVSLYVVYRKLKPDLFMLAAACLSVIVISVTYFGKILFDTLDMEIGSILFLAIFTIAMGSTSAMWLRKLNQEFNHAE